jgi:plastocyanin
MTSPRRSALFLMLAIGAASAQAADHAVKIEGMKFIPERLEVRAGDTITWTNQDFLPHSVTAAKAHVESGEIAPNKRFKLVAKKKGEMPYICRLHPSMQGTVVVK